MLKEKQGLASPDKIGRMRVRPHRKDMSLLKYESQLREPLVDGDKDYHQITEDIVRPIEMKPSRLWYIGFYISVALLLFGVYSVYREVTYGIGQWNLNKTIGWGWDI